MSIDAMKQALEALEHLHRTGDTQVFDLCYAPEVIPALRLAIEQAERQEPVAWKNAAMRLGEELSSVGPDGYYDMTAEQWLDWAMDQRPTGKQSLQVEKQKPVAAQHRFRHPQKTMPDWSPWQPADVSDRPSWEIDSQGYEVEYRLLYPAPPQRQPMVVSQECAKRGCVAHDDRVDGPGVVIEQAEKQEPVAFPEGYEPHELPADYTGRLWIEGQVRRLHEECNEQARLLGMSAERELRLRAINAQLLEALEATTAMLDRSDCLTGYCCCGSPVDGHGFGDGHTPVDEGAYHQANAVERARAAIAAAKENHA